MVIERRALVIDDDADVIAGVTALLELDSWDVRGANSGRTGIAAFTEFSPDVVLLDVQLPDMSGIEVLQNLKMYSEAVSVVMMSGAGTFERVVESMKYGAETFLQKPFDFETLSLTLKNVSRMIGTRRELAARRRGDVDRGERLPGISPSINALNQLIPEVARVPSPVLMEGESGTGKGVLARLIHSNAPRSRSPFVDLNCAGLSKELLESELFGHERGAFTNAVNTKPGLFEVVADGTLFLDEIGEMDITVQARLLKALEEKRFRRVGGVRDLRADFRLLAATNRNLAGEVTAGRFRADLYYRLNVVRLRLPPLRERLEDIPILVEVLLRALSNDIGRPLPRVSPIALQKLATYPWPGNVRELRNVLERSLLTLKTSEIRSEDLLLEGGTRPARSSDAAAGVPSSEWDIRPLDDVIAEYISAAVNAAGGNVRKAAREMKVSPSTIYARMKSRQ